MASSEDEGSLQAITLTGTGAIVGLIGGRGLVATPLTGLFPGEFASRLQVSGCGLPRNPSIASGKSVVKARFAVAALTPYVACANCGEAQIQPKDADSYFAEVEVETSASPRDRIAALEHAAKYGLGALKETTVEEVTERLGRTLDILQANTTPELFATLVRLIEPEWR